MRNFEKSFSFTQQQWAVLSALTLQAFFVAIVYSMIGPFFPLHARNLGLSKFEIGTVFSIFSLTMLLSGPFFGKWATKVGKKRLLIVGIIVECFCSVAFGLSNELWEFLTLRGIQGIGSAASNTATFAMLGSHFPQKLGVINGIIETLIGIGYMLGPPVGGWLYELGGFPLPFIGTGVTMFLLLTLVASLLPKDDRADNIVPEIVADSEFKSPLENTNVISTNTPENGDSGTLLNRSHDGNDHFTKPSAPSQCQLQNDGKSASPFIVFCTSSSTVTAGVIVAVSIGFGILDSTLALHLQDQLNLSALQISACFFATSAAYTIFAPLGGYVVDRTGRYKMMMFFGIIILGASYLGLGFSPTGNLFWWMIFACSLLGMAGAIGMVPSFPDLLGCTYRYVHKQRSQGNQKYGSQYGSVRDVDPSGDDLSRNDVKEPRDLDIISPVAGAHTTLYAIGQIVGPVTGTSLADLTGNFSMMYDILALTFSVYALFALFPLVVGEFRTLKHRRIDIVSFDFKSHSQKPGCGNTQQENVNDSGDADTCERDDSDDSDAAWRPLLGNRGMYVNETLKIDRPSGESIPHLLGIQPGLTGLL